MPLLLATQAMEKLKILIPTDFSIQPEYAYLLVKRLEDKLPVEVHFLHVMTVPDTVTIDENGSINTCGEIDINFLQVQKQMAERKLNHLKETYGNDIQTHLLFGKVTDQIVNFSASNRFDLVAMGTKGAWGLKEKLSGSDTQMVTRKSEVPVLSLMCDRSDLQINHILLVHDFNSPHVHGLDLMKRLLIAFDAKLHQLQWIDGIDDNQRAQLIEKMDAHAKNQDIFNYENHLITDADTESAVIHFNQMVNMDLICIGNLGNEGFFRSNSAEKLIKHLFKPIISFHI